MTSRPRSAKRALLTLIEAGYRDGHSPATIARWIGYKRQTICIYARQMGLRYSPNKPQSIEPSTALIAAAVAYRNALQNQSSGCTVVLVAPVENSQDHVRGNPSSERTSDGEENEGQGRQGQERLLDP